MINYDKFEIFMKETKLADVEIIRTSRKPKVQVVQYVDNHFRQFRGCDSDITWETFLQWLDWRTVPETRANISVLLEDWGIDHYNRFAIIKHTHGVMGHDDVWVRFDGEDLTYQEVNSRSI